MNDYPARPRFLFDRPRDLWSRTAESSLGGASSVDNDSERALAARRKLRRSANSADR